MSPTPENHRPTICQLEEKELKKFLDYMQHDGRTICDTCLESEPVNEDFKNKFGERYYYVFNTGTCEVCGKVGEVMYLPVGKFVLESESMGVMDWYNRHPRNRDLIAADILSGNKRLNFLSKRTIEFLEKLAQMDRKRHRQDT